MSAEFDDLRSLAKSLYKEGFSDAGDAVFSVSSPEGPSVAFAAIPGEPASVLIRARILDLKEVRRADDFAKAALAGNFFWGGARGATLSIGSDGALYISERRPLETLGDASALEECIADFTASAADWKERSALYA